MWVGIYFWSFKVVEKKNEKAPKPACDKKEYKGCVYVWLNFWASRNWSGQVHFESHSPEW